MSNPNILKRVEQRVTRSALALCLGAVVLAGAVVHNAVDRPTRAVPDRPIARGITGPELIALQQDEANRIATGRDIRVLEATVICPVGKSGLIMIVNPLVRYVDGQMLVGAIETDNSPQGFRVGFLQYSNPGVPVTDQPSCQSIESVGAPDKMGTQIDVVLGSPDGPKGGPFTARYYDQKTGTVGDKVLTTYGGEIEIGLISSNT